MAFTTQDWKHAHPLESQRIGVVGRVGSGRTTLAVLIGREMTKRGYHVCFLDADTRPTESFRAFGLESPPEPLRDFLKGDSSSLSSRRIPYGDRKIHPSLMLPLEEIPKSFSSKTEEGIVFLSLEGAHPPEDLDMDEWILQDLRIQEGRTRPVVLMKLDADSKTPSPELLASLDWVLVVVDPTYSSLELAAEVGDRVTRLQKEAPAGTLVSDPIPGGDSQGSAFGESHHTGVLAVLNHIPDPETEQAFITAISQQAHVQPVGAIREDWDMSISGQSRRPVPHHKAELSVIKVLDQIEAMERRAALTATG